MDEQPLIAQAWNKATKVPGFDPSMIRKDSCGALIVKSEYGNRNSKFGWEIDHAYPLSKGGDDDISNIRAMQWENNVAKGDDFPVYHSAVKAVGNDNVPHEGQYRINKKLFDELRTRYKF